MFFFFFTTQVLNGKTVFIKTVFAHKGQYYESFVLKIEGFTKSYIRTPMPWLTTDLQSILKAFGGRYFIEKMCPSEYNYFEAEDR